LDNERVEKTLWPQPRRSQDTQLFAVGQAGKKQWQLELTAEQQQRQTPFCLLAG